MCMFNLNACQISHSFPHSIYVLPTPADPFLQHRRSLLPKQHAPPPNAQIDETLNYVNANSLVGLENSPDGQKLI